TTGFCGFLRVSGRHALRLRTLTALSLSKQERCRNVQTRAPTAVPFGAEDESKRCAVRKAACRAAPSFCAQTQSAQSARSYGEAEATDRSFDRRVRIQQSCVD